MPAARTEIPLVVLNPANSNFLPGAQVSVLKRSDSSVVPVYTTETSNTTIAQPLITDAQGRVTGWVAREAITFSIVSAGNPTYVEDYDSSTATAGSVDSTWLGDASVTTAKIVNSAVSTAKIAPAAVDNSKLADGAVSGAKLADGAVSGAKLADGSLTTAKLAASSVTTVKLQDASVSDNKILSTNNTVWRTIFQASGYIDNSSYNAYLPANGGGVTPGLSTALFPFTSTDYLVGGLSGYGRILAIYTGRLTPVNTSVTISLVPITGTSGDGDLTNGASIGGTDLSFNGGFSLAAANSVYYGSASTTLALASNILAFKVSVAGVPTAGSRGTITAFLQTRHA